MPLTSSQRKQLLPRCNVLKSIVTVGNAGITDAVIAELDQALLALGRLDSVSTLLAHELVKVRVNAADRAARSEMITRLGDATGADLVQAIGHVAVLYRPQPG